MSKATRKRAPLSPNVVSLAAEREKRRKDHPVGHVLPERDAGFLLALALFEALKGDKAFLRACGTVERIAAAHPHDREAQGALAAIDVLRGKARV